MKEEEMNAGSVNRKTEPEEPLLRLCHLSKKFQGRGKQTVLAVRDVSLELDRGECLGIVGESGCGKSTLGRMIIGTYPPDRGEIWMNGKNLTSMNVRQRNMQSRNIQMIFQHPAASFSPRMLVMDYLWEPLRNYRHMSRKEALPEIVSCLESVGLSEDALTRYPYEFSGGQLQRIAIARAALLHPELIVCDEVTSALDVSVQRQIMELFIRLRQHQGCAYLFIGHDLALVQQISQRIAVMYLGEIVEILDSGELRNAVHPYTRALLAAVFTVPKTVGELHLLKGDPPRITDDFAGCSFASRCERCTQQCRNEKPTLREIRKGHWVACHR